MRLVTFLYLSVNEVYKTMSIQEMKSRIHQLVDEIDREPALEKLLETANELWADQSPQLATLTDLTNVQRERLDLAIQQHQEGKTVSHEEMKQRQRQWLNK